MGVPVNTRNRLGYGPPPCRMGLSNTARAVVALVLLIAVIVAAVLIFGE